MPITNEADNDLQLLNSHQPGLDAGFYTITMEQNLTIKQADKKEEKTSFKKTVEILVANDRYALQPDEIQGVFPPPNSVAAHKNVLPHILLNRSTLPWERHAEINNKDLPWLLLLVVTEEENAEIQTKSMLLKQLLDNNDPVEFPKLISSTTQPPANGFFNYAQTEEKELNERLVQIIDIPKATLQKLLPSVEQLPYTTHVRKTKNTETAAILSNRLLNDETRYVAYLVSIEGCYRAKKNIADETSKNTIRLICLKTWRFISHGLAQNYLEQLVKINANSKNSFDNTLKLPDEALHQTNTAEHSKALRYIKAGYVPFPHWLRQGSNTYSWYRGPLLPGNPAAQTAFEPLITQAKTADALLRYDTNSSMFDITYSAAWELGRMLALQDQQFMNDLHQCKCAHRQEQHMANCCDLDHLPICVKQPTLPETAKNTVNDFIENLQGLEGVPLHYLVPDERMLPIESLRFFTVDPNWVACLVEGALSVGRTTSGDHSHDQQLMQKHFSHLKQSSKNITGFLLRSNFVAAWPQIEVEAYSVLAKDIDKATTLKVRSKKVTSNILLCLVEGEVKTVLIYPHPEVTHFELKESHYLRDLNSGKLTNKKLNYQPPVGNSCINLTELTNKMGAQILGPEKKLDTAQLALQLLADVTKVSFQNL